LGRAFGEKKEKSKRKITTVASEQTESRVRDDGEKIPKSKKISHLLFGGRRP